MSQFIELQKAWLAKGGGQCDHPATDKEYYLGSQTGDRGCLVCGETWPSGQVPRVPKDEPEAG